MLKSIVKILVASGDIKLSKALKESTDGRGFKFYEATDGVESIYLAEKISPDVIIIDSDLPKIPALEVASLIKKIPKLQHGYIIYLYPKNSMTSSVKMNGIADEYIEKPVNIKNLFSRVNLHSKPNLTYDMNLRKTIGDLTIDRETYVVNYKKSEILLPRKEFELLYLLASRPEKVFTREEIFRNIWGKEISPKAGRTIDVHIRKLRSKISENIIVTIKGVGYRIMT